MFVGPGSALRGGAVWLQGAARWLAGLLLVSAAAVHAQPATRCVLPERSGYLDGELGTRTSVVVFVHGVLSSTVGAWTSDTGVSWPCLLRQEPGFDRSNIYLYGYESSAFSVSPTIQKVAERMLSDLNSARVLNHAHVTIVAHSMGGLVTSRMLLLMKERADFRPLLQRIKLVKFYGTPGTGADIADVAAVFSDNIQFEEMKTGSGPAELLRQWSAEDWSFKWFCLAEGQRTRSRWYNWIGTRVVVEESARALCNRRPHAFDVIGGADHVTLVKPETLGAPPHDLLKRRFETCVRDAVARRQPESRATTPEGQDAVRVLADLRGSLQPTRDGGAIPEGAIESVRAMLFNYGTKSDDYVFPRDRARPSLLADGFELIKSPIFAHEFVKLFVQLPFALVPAWVGRLSELPAYASDGLLTETLGRWQAAGIVQPDDVVAALEPRADLGQPVIVGARQALADGQRAWRLRGLLIVPPPPQDCR